MFSTLSVYGYGEPWSQELIQKPIQKLISSLLSDNPTSRGCSYKSDHSCASVCNAVTLATPAGRPTKLAFQPKIV